MCHAQETLQRVCAAYHACVAEFRRRVPTDYFDKEMKVIDKGLPGCNATSTPSSSLNHFVRFGVIFYLGL